MKAATQPTGLLSRSVTTRPPRVTKKVTPAAMEASANASIQSKLPSLLFFPFLDRISLLLSFWTPHLITFTATSAYTLLAPTAEL